MNLESFLKRRQIQHQTRFKPREQCLTCLRAKLHCYCATIRRFNPKLKFVILIHHLEDRRSIATGRMSHLCIEGSELILGQDYTNNSRINSLVSNQEYFPVVLYPGGESQNLSRIEYQKRLEIFPQNKKPLIFVIDGTWKTAKKMIRSENLFKLPRICFTPPAPSKFRVRKQPSSECYSTLEAIHHLIDLIGGSNNNGRSHDGLLFSFEWMIRKQLEYQAASLPGTPPNT